MARAKSFIIILVTIAISIVLAHCRTDKHSEDPVKVEKQISSYFFNNDSVHYVGIETCKQCHYSIYQSYIQTGMGQSFGYATPSKSAARFGPEAVIYDSINKFYYHSYFNKDSLYMLEFRMQGHDTVYKRIEKVSYIIGSGQHTNSHMMNTNGFVHQMPMTYYTQKKKWDLPPGFENGANTRFARKIGLECMTCHNSLPTIEKGSENKFDAVPQGINCERCHGPGSAHVQLKQKGVVIDTSKYIDYSIVNPSKLPISRQFDLCQRCHLQGDAVLKDNKSFLDFKPGMRLSDVMTIFLPRYQDAENDFIMASHADRLKKSRCFKESLTHMQQTNSLKPYKNALTCVSCHNPHVSVKYTGQEIFNNTCKSCHAKPENLKCSETVTIRQTKNDNCVSCHMPKSGASDIPHVRITDHYIRKPSKELSTSEVIKIKKFLGLTAINEANPQPKVKAEAYLNYFEKFEPQNTMLLDSARFYLLQQTDSLSKSNLALSIRLNFLQHNYFEIIRRVATQSDSKICKLYNQVTFDNNDAWTLYRIGESYNMVGNTFKTIQYYQLASQLAPFQIEFKNKYATSLIANNQLPQALNELSDLVKLDNRYAPAYCNRGYVYFLMHEYKLAENEYKKAMQIDPDYTQVAVNQYILYTNWGRMQAAQTALQTFLTMHPDNPTISKLLKVATANKR